MPMLTAALRRAPERGATAVEYALMAGLVALVVIAAVTALGLAVSGHFAAGAGLFAQVGPVAAPIEPT